MHQYSPGSKVRFVTTYQHADGTRFDPIVAKVVFQDPIGGVADSLLSKQGETGMYGVTFTVPANAVAGFYDFYFYGTYLDNSSNVVEYKGQMDYVEVVQIGASMDTLPQNWYCTVGDIRLRLPLLTQAKMSDANVEVFIVGAMGEVDSRIGNRYHVPFTNVPNVIRAITRDLACSEILDTMFSGDANGEPSLLADRLRKNAMEMLAPIISGQTMLPGSSSSPPFRISNFKIVTGQPTPLTDMMTNYDAWGPPGVAP